MLSNLLPRASHLTAPWCKRGETLGTKLGWQGAESACLAPMCLGSIPRPGVHLELGPVKP